MIYLKLIGIITQLCVLLHPMIIWVVLGIFSSFFLGFHEIFKKVALEKNAVIPVLFAGSASGALVFVPFLILSCVFPDTEGSIFFIPKVTIEGHLFFMLKSAIVSTAWLFGYFSVKHLPVTLLAPVNASGPVWTLLGAMLIYTETLNVLQWTGVATAIGSYYLLSFGSNNPDKKYYHTRWLFFAFLGILFNSISALLDKYLVQHFDRIAMQAWFSVYTSVIFLIVMLLMWFPARHRNTPFTWKWAIVLIGVFLVIADFFYFKALSYENSLVSILIIIRRASAVIVFTAGALYFKETSLKKRLVMLAGILAGVVLIVLGSN